MYRWQKSLLRHPEFRHGALHHSRDKKLEYTRYHTTTPYFIVISSERSSVAAAASRRISPAHVQDTFEGKVNPDFVLMVGRFPRLLGQVDAL
jgi:hypothetical protein